MQNETSLPSSPSSRPAAGPRFHPGQVLATPAALAALQSHQCGVLALLQRHLHCDWGDVSLEDAALNNQALQVGHRLLSSYRIAANVRIWLITQADRSSTTVLLPGEY